MIKFNYYKTKNVKYYMQLKYDKGGGPEDKLAPGPLKASYATGSFRPYLGVQPYASELVYSEEKVFNYEVQLC